MPQTFVVDQAATFSAVAFLECNPKNAFGTTTQEKSNDGTPKWEVQAIAGFKQFGKSAHEVIKVTVTQHGNPGDGISPYTPVAFVGFVVGVTPPEVRKDANGRERLTGGSAWYRADGLQPALLPTSSKSKSE